MLGQYIPIIVLGIVALKLGAGKIIASHLFGPRRYSKSKLSVYECGVLPLTSARLKFPIKYFIIALVFIIFDVEVLFMYPWAVVYKDFLANGMFVFYEMLVFIGILLVGYVYVWKKGGLEWG